MKRKHIPLAEKLAATLACLLSQQERDAMRERKTTAAAVIRLFEFDHLVLHAMGGCDAWHNLDPKQVAHHRAKSRRDTGIAAKAKRIDRKWHEFMAAVAAGRKPPPRKSRWPKRRMRA
jgi:hypothetical protein